MSVGVTGVIDFGKNNPELNTELGTETNDSAVPGAPYVVKSRLRLTRKGKLVVSALMLLLLAAIAGTAIYFLSTPNAVAGNINATQIVHHEVVTVKSGDNLWSLVSKHAPVDVDVRDYLLLVQEINGLESAVVHPGQQLNMPIN